MRETIKILLADRYPIIAEGLEYLISLEDGMEVIAEDDEINHLRRLILEIKRLE